VNSRAATHASLLRGPPRGAETARTCCGQDVPQLPIVREGLRDPDPSWNVTLAVSRLLPSPGCGRPRRHPRYTRCGRSTSVRSSGAPTRPLSERGAARPGTVLARLQLTPTAELDEQRACGPTLIRRLLLSRKRARRTFATATRGSPRPQCSLDVAGAHGARGRAASAPRTPRRVAARGQSRPTPHVRSRQIPRPQAATSVALSRNPLRHSLRRCLAPDTRR
jgi:hypothetical protein